VFNFKFTYLYIFDYFLLFSTGFTCKVLIDVSLYLDTR
jgi:hypothetical protein